jgi:uncharacterized membrane-anchored protein
MSLPKFHSHRFVLNDEVHARPSQAISSPARISYLVLVSSWAKRDSDLEPMRALAQRYGRQLPAPDARFHAADLGPFRVKWERHTEFTRYTFSVAADDTTPEADPFAATALDSVPEDWIGELPGELLVAAHAAVVKAPRAAPDFDALSKTLFAANMLVGSAVAGGGALAITDFRIRGDGFSRFLVHDRRMTPWQTGRVVQRLFDLETYRMMALLALPMSQELGPVLTQQEHELDQITSSMAGAQEAEDPLLLDRLTRLQSAIESRHSQSHYRFSAARAYDDLVRQRIEELREERIEGLQTFEEFTNRRLAPAMKTCEATATRQDSLSNRVARATQLLSTRVDIAREKQNQALLESMNRRAALQLRLQETVEGLSVAAITYYVVGLIGYAAKGLKAGGAAVNVPLVQGLSIPVVIILVALGVRSIRKAVGAPLLERWRFW